MISENLKIIYKHDTTIKMASTQIYVIYFYKYSPELICAREKLIKNSSFALNITGLHRDVC